MRALPIPALAVPRRQLLGKLLIGVQGTQERLPCRVLATIRQRQELPLCKVPSSPPVLKINL